MSEKLSYTPTEFANKMGVSYSTVKHWLKNGKVPGAFQQGDGIITLKRWRIPKEALGMERPLVGSRKGMKYRSKSVVMKELKTELVELKESHLKLMETHAALRGRHDHVNELYEQALHDLKHKEMEVEALKEGLDIADSKLRLLEARVDELDGGKAAPQLSIRGQ